MSTSSALVSLSLAVAAVLPLIVLAAMAFHLRRVLARRDTTLPTRGHDERQNIIDGYARAYRSLTVAAATAFAFMLAPFLTLANPTMQAVAMVAAAFLGWRAWRWVKA